MYCLRLISICLFLISFAACSKNTTDQPEPDPEPDNSAATDYLLDEIVYENPTDPYGQKFLFTYNSDNRVSEVTQSYWIDYSNGVSAPQKKEQKVTFNFTYQNKLVSRSIMVDGIVTRDVSYHYLGDRLISKVGRLNNIGSSTDSIVYQYSSDGKPQETTLYVDNVLRGKTPVTNINGVITSFSTIYEFTGNVKYKMEYSDFDTKANFTKAINGLPKIFGFLEFPFSSDGGLSENNFRRYKWYQTRSESDPFTTPEIDATYSYEYNDAGLPVSKTEGKWTLKYKYRKYRN